MLTASPRSPRSWPTEALARWVRDLPKTALHVHIEGTLEPELAFALAERNGLTPGSTAFPYATLEQLRAAYHFGDLGAFLDLYYAVAGVLRTESDFYALAKAYGERLVADSVRWAEIFFDPQTHTSRGIPFTTVVNGLHRGFAEAREHGTHIALIACWLRDAPVGNPDELDTADPAQGFGSMKQATAWATAGQLFHYNQSASDKARIIGVGLDSYEAPHPPERFTELFQQAHRMGLRTTAHAGEEGPPAYIWTALQQLEVSRIDHGIRCIEDPALVSWLSTPHDTPSIIAAYGEPHRIPLTVCPHSNVRLQVFPDPTRSNLLELLELGVLVSIHSDDPAYFGGYASDNYRSVIEWLDPTWEQLRRLAHHGVQAAWAPAPKKRAMLEQIDAYFASSGIEEGP